ncbi:hypothetical protein H1R20_g10098, partial [Candolleomyces eurysporus]
MTMLSKVVDDNVGQDAGSSMALHFYNLADPTSGDVINTQELAELTGMCLHADVYDFEKIIGRPLTVIERNLFGWEPRCAACGITDRMIRIRAKQQGQPSSTQLQKCMDCQSTFFCSPRHFALIKKTHGTVPINGYGNLSQCQLNQQIREDVRFFNLLADAKTSISPDAPTALADSAPLTWAPERVMDEWSSLKGSTWEGEFASHLDVPAGKGPFLRSASDGLALPMTILYALEVLNGEWKPKDTLVIHVLGPSGPEIQNSMVFEEIVHRLPGLKRLELLLCGPEMSAVNQTDTQGGPEMELDTCPTYHEHIQQKGSSFKVPDLAVAFNSGASEVESDSWKETMKMLIEKKVPSVFTSFNELEAGKESAMLSELGAPLVPELGPCRNPWGSMLLKTEPGRLDGFYNSNGWFAGGFK